MQARTLRTGMLLAGVYAAAVLATAVGTGHPVRPLFDGVGNSTPYRWVRPPWYVGAANVKPEANTTDIAFENRTSPLMGVTSQDAQLVLNFPQAALLPRAGDTVVRVAITPLDPKKLAKPPDDLRPDGNAYRVEMTYQPSNQPLPAAVAPGNAIMIVPDEADSILYSADGRGWEVLQTHVLGDPNTVGTAFTKSGYYLVGTRLPEFANPNKGQDTKRVIGWVLVAVALALTFGFLPVMLRRSRAAQAAQASARRRGSNQGRGRATRPVRRRRRQRR